jgi:hypothetical protein
MTSLKSRSKGNPQFNLVIQNTNRCHRGCRDCFQIEHPGKNGNMDLDREDQRRSILPYIRKNGFKVAVTEVGGEACRHLEFVPMTEEIIASRPHSLDIFTSGELFSDERPDFWCVLSQTCTELKVVLSYDENHRQGCEQADSWLDAGFAKMRREWDFGSSVGFVVSSTRFSDQPEEKVEQSMHEASASNRIPIEVSYLGWDNVFRWAKDYVVRIVVPVAEMYFELANRNGNGSSPRIEFVYRRDFFNLTPNSVEQSIQPALGKSFHSIKYGVSLEISGKSRMESILKTAS